MAEAYFYHLTRSPLEDTLPMLLEKSRAAGWREAVRGTAPDRLRHLHERLWRYPEDGFLPHGLAGDGFEADQPVLLTTGAEVPNGAEMLISIDGAEITPEEAGGFTRVCVVFDGNDESAVVQARTQWTRLTGAGLPARYWSQESGRWAEKASKNC